MNKQFQKIRFTGKAFSVPVLMALVLMATGCGHADNSKEREAASLYRESCKLLKDYTDSLRRAADSASVERISADYEEKVAKLNFNYRADTDLEMTEQENENLAKLSATYAEARRSRLEKLHLASRAVESKTEADTLSHKPKGF